MSDLIYYTDKRRLVPQLERTDEYIDTLNVTKPRINYNKSGVMNPIINLKDDNLENKLIEWKKSKNYNLAGDILSQAMIQKKIYDIDDVKKYMLSKYSTDNVLNWLFKKRNKELNNDDKINYNYRKLKLEPKDSLTWTDQAINFLLINNREESIKCIEEALKINSNLGFIIRNASRIFSLTGDNSRSIKILKNSEYYKYDPQILSAEIAFSQLENRKTIGIEIGQKLLNDYNYKNGEKSELASTIGTIEFLKGEFKKSEKFFSLSLLEPNKNSLAQYLWYKKDDVNLQQFRPKIDSNEIETHINFKKNNFIESLKYSLKWKNDEPYSLRPYRVSSHLSGVLLGDYQKAFELIKQGLEIQKLIKADNFTHKEEMSLNNDIAYYLLKAGKITEAEKYLNPFLELTNKSSKLENFDCICIATLGLLAYKQNNEDLGRQLYRKSIKYFFDTEKPYLASSAFLNFFDEEINFRFDIESLEKLRNELDDIVPNNTKNDLLFRKSKSIKLFNETIKHVKENFKK